MDGRAYGKITTGLLMVVGVCHGMAFATIIL